MRARWHDGHEDAAVVVFTGDQDWAPAWAVEETVGLFENCALPFHLFRTNVSHLYDIKCAVPSGFTSGWHPNFLPGSSHGADLDSVIQEMQRLVPLSRSVRSHSFLESSSIWQALSRTSVIAESHGLTDLETYVKPMRMGSGFIRFPLFLEDDHFLANGPTMAPMKRLWNNLRMPGLKVLNFHPIHLALNTPSVSAYMAWKENVRKNDLSQAYEGYGTRNLLLEIIEFSKQEDLRIVSFEVLIDEVLNNGI